MGLSRRQSTKEFKLAALQGLEMGTRVAEVARAIEFNVLTRREDVESQSGFPSVVTTCCL